MDYKEMYLKMMRETEKAIDILIKAQRECEEMYISMSEEEYDHTPYCMKKLSYSLSSCSSDRSSEITLSSKGRYFSSMRWILSSSITSEERSSPKII